MAEAAFNMIAETQRLRDAGLPHGQAEAVTLAIHAGVTGGVASRADVEALRGDFKALRGDFKALRGDVTREMEALRGDVTREMEVLRGDVTRDIEALRGDVSRDVETLRGDFRALEVRVDAKIDRLGTDLKWIRAIGGVIVAILVLPWLAELLGAAVPGP